VSLGSRLTAEPYFYGYPRLGPEVRRVVMQDGFSSHTLAQLDFPANKVTRMQRVKERTPVHMPWGTGRDQRNFYGYVNHAEIIEGERSVDSFLRMTLLGTSMRLNQTYAANWYDCSPTMIVKEVAQRRGFRAVMHFTDRRLPYWTQGTMSDSKMLRALADKVGYRTWVDGSTIYFLDPTKVLNKSASPFVPEFTKDTGLKRIHITDGSLAPRDTTTSVQKIIGIDERSHQLIEYSSSKAIKDRNLPVPETAEYGTVNADSLAEAQYEADAAALGTNEWTTAVATLENAHRLTPSSLVNFDGVDLSSNYTGLWMVVGAKHLLDLENSAPKIVSRVEVTRNDSNTLVFQFKEQLKRTPAEVPAVLRDGKNWESSRLEAIYVG